MEDAVRSGLEYLYEECSEENAFQNNTVGKERLHLATCFPPEEVMTSLVALDLIGDLLDEESRTFILNFVGPKPETPIIGLKHLYQDPENEKWKEDAHFPYETDVTALFMSVYLKRGLIEKNDELIALARTLIENVNKDGVIQIYLPPREEWEGKVDATACCNVMRLLYTLELGEEAKATEDYIFSVLENKKYLEISENYVSPDIFLFYLARAVNCNPKAKDRFAEPLINAVKDRLGHRADNPYLEGKQKYTIDIAGRLLALHALGLLEDEDLSDKIEMESRTLKSMQDDEGAFKEDCLFKREVLCAFFGGKVIPTIFGIAACDCFCEKD